MSGRRALISKDDLNRMAATVAAHEVVFEGRTNADGELVFRMTPLVERDSQNSDDLDERLIAFGGGS